jgi:hypothetical protein
MQILFNFKRYERPKKAILYSNGNNYIYNNKENCFGWEKIEKEETIIGEDETSYIIKLIKYKECDINDINYNKIVLLPVGYHKSRLIKFIHESGQQLLLFE